MEKGYNVKHKKRFLLFAQCFQDLQLNTRIQTSESQPIRGLQIILIWTSLKLCRVCKDINCVYIDCFGVWSLHGVYLL